MLECFQYVNTEGEYILLPVKGWHVYQVWILVVLARIVLVIVGRIQHLSAPMFLVQKLVVFVVEFPLSQELVVILG